MTTGEDGEEERKESGKGMTDRNTSEVFPKAGLENYPDFKEWVRQLLLELVGKMAFGPWLVSLSG